MAYRIKRLPINIAGIPIIIRLKGQGRQQFYARLRKAFMEFVSEGKGPGRPGYYIEITSPYSGGPFNLSQKGKTLKVLASEKVLKNKKPWQVFLDIITKHLWDYLLSCPNMILLHSAGCAKDNKGYLFLGPSKSGKTTVAKLSRGYSVLSDDKVLVRSIGGKYYLFKLPLFSCDSKRPREDIKTPVALDKIFLLKKSRRLCFKKLSRNRALAALLEGSRELSRVFKADIEEVFDTAYGLASSIPVFEMHFKKDSLFWGEIGRL